MPDELIYLVRDRQGNVFGPADAEMLRAWVGEGRIVAGMFIAPRETREWVEASSHPTLSDLLRERAGETNQALGRVAVPPEIIDSPEVTVTRHIPEDHPEDFPRAPVGNFMSTLAFFLGVSTGFGTCASCLPWINGFAVPATGLVALSAIVLGACGLWQINAHPNYYRGRPLAILGVLLGIMALFAELVIVTARTLWHMYF